jgi:hypothetical protein
MKAVRKKVSSRGSKPGERRGGRQKGTLNKSTASVKEMAGAFGPEAIATLADIMANGDSDAGRVAAAKEILDRAYGKSTTVIGNAEGEALRVVNEIILRGVRPDDPARH